MKKKNRAESRIRSLVWDLIHNNKWQDLDDFSLKLADRLLETATSSIFSMQNVQEAIKRTRTNFFVVNKISKQDFSQLLFPQLSQIDLTEHLQLSRFEAAMKFISDYLEVGYDKSRCIEERTRIIALFGSIKNPHAKLLNAFETLLQKISESFQVALHGTKEYSGVDISKKTQEATLGFQMKSKNDDISEDKMRSQTSKALEHGLDGFVWIYGCPVTKDVDSSIQAGYHYFRKINASKKMYCALIHPELLAELFRKNKINLE